MIDFLKKLYKEFAGYLTLECELKIIHWSVGIYFQYYFKLSEFFLNNLL